MSNIFKKILESEKTNQIAKASDLRKFQSFGNNIEIVPESNIHPEHLIAHGRLLQNGKPALDIKTAITKRGNDVEFSTNVGQVQNTQLGGAITDRLSHAVDGKLVAYPNQQEPDKVDLVYATRKPSDWLNQQRFSQELENHAKVKDVVNPVLDASLRLAQPKRNLNYPELQTMAEDIVTSNLKLQHRLSDKLAASKYFPTLKTKK